MKQLTPAQKKYLGILIILSIALFITLVIQHDVLRPLDLSANLLFKEAGLPYYYFFNFMSFLGSIYWIPLMFVLFVWLLWKKKKQHAAIFLAVATLSNYVVVSLLKMFTNWSRPEEVQRAIAGTFPSAHASTPFVLYVLAYLFLVEKPKKSAFIGLVIGCLLIGFSRIIVNAHWLTDVVAGILLAIAWISAGLLMYKK